MTGVTMTGETMTGSKGPPWDLIPGPMSGSGPRGGAHALLSHVPRSCTVLESRMRERVVDVTRMCMNRDLNYPPSYSF